MAQRQPEPLDIHELAMLADEALSEAIKLPSGMARSEALKKASLLRIAADKQGIRFARRGRPSLTK
jgi:hypothetical protein